MAVIASTILVVRRIADLQRRRQILSERQDRLRRSLPEWTFAPLPLVGMSAGAIQAMMNDLDRAEAGAGLTDVEAEIEQIDRQLEELESTLLATPSRSLDAIQAVLELAISRFREQTATDPNDLFYDYGDARILFLLERAADPERGREFTRLMGRLLAEPEYFFGRIAPEQFHSVRERFLAAFRRALPQLSPAEVFWRVMLMIGTVAAALRMGEFGPQLSGGQVPPANPEQTRRRLLEFLTAGLRARPAKEVKP